MKLGTGMGLCGLMIALMVLNCTVWLTNLPKLQDLMRLNVERNFGMLSSSGDGIVLCRVLRWGVESDYTGTPYNVLIRANIVPLPYNLVALSQALHALRGPWTRAYVSGKVRLVGPARSLQG